MTRSIGRVLLSVLLLAGVLSADGPPPAAEPPAANAPAAGGEAPLTYVAGEKLLPLYQPSTFGGADTRFLVWGSSGSVKFAGLDWKVAGTHRAAVYYFALDADCSGKIDRSEVLAAQAAGSLLVKVKRPLGNGKDGDYAVLLSPLQFAVLDGKLSTISGWMRPGCAWDAAIDGVAVRIYDENLDGRITQDGLDSIRIGDSEASIPLGKVHVVGQTMLALEMAADATALKWKPAPDEAMAETRLAEGVKDMAHLVVADSKGRVFDLVKSPKVPAGEYFLCFGVLKNATSELTFTPNPLGVKVTLAADKVNELPFGKPKVDFLCTTIDGDFWVRPEILIVGEAGEMYTLDVASSEAGIDPPVISLVSKGKVLGQTTMGYG